MFESWHSEFVSHLGMELLNSQTSWKNNKDADKYKSDMRVFGMYAFALYVHMVESGYPKEFDPQLKAIRNCEPDDPVFFQHADVISDVIGA